MTRNVKESTKNLLWARAAGHCEYCGKGVTHELFERRTDKFGQIAHIKADAPGGPRYDPEQSEEDRNSIDNLMLLCHDCHRLIDSYPESYSVESLSGMKSSFEEKVLRAVDAIGPDSADVITLTVPIGDGPLTITDAEWRKALVDAGIALVNERAFSVELSSGGSFASRMSEISKRLERFREVIHNDKDGKTALFAVAPQPLLIGLGHILGDDDSVFVFQRDREHGGWSWVTEGTPNTFTVEANCDGKSEDCALVVSVSGTVNRASYVDALPSKDLPIYTLRAARQESSAIRLRDDWDKFKHCFVDGIFRIHEEHPEVKRLHVFPAAPVSAAVAVGMAWNDRVIPEMVIYEKNRGTFERALTIGGKDEFAA